MEQSELKIIIEKHEKWLRREDGGERANLCNAKLCGADLHNANLRNADLSRADLHNADLHNADLTRAELYSADMRGVDMRGANLCGADLSRANLYCANLSGADMLGAELYGANLYRATNAPFIPMSCPTNGSFVGYKKASGFIVKLLIPEDAKRSSSTCRKCRCDKADVLAIEHFDGTPAGTFSVCSDYDKSFVYEVGKTVIEPNFCEDRFKECAEGIHFFIDRQEAVDY